MSSNHPANRGSKWIAQHTRLAIYRRDKFRCLFCGRHASETMLSLDHITPVAYAGKDTVDNLTTVCHACNSRRQTMTIKQFATVSGRRPSDVQNELESRLARPLDKAGIRQTIRRYGYTGALAILSQE